MRMLLLYTFNDPPGWSRICDIVTSEAILALAGMQEANHPATAIEDQGTRVPIGSKRPRALAVLVDSKFHGHSAVFVALERLDASIGSNSEIGGGAILEDNEAGFAVFVGHIWVSEEFLGNDAIDSELSFLNHRVLESCPGIVPGIHHPGKLVG